MKINGSLVFDASTASEIQNLRLQKVTALPTIGDSDVGRLVYNTNTNVIHVGTNVGNVLSWVPLATGGDASSLLAEVDRIETALGLNANGSFNAAAFTGTLANQTSYATLITTLQGLVTAATDAIASEATTRGDADSTIIGRIDDVEESVTAGNTASANALAAEVTRATGAEGILTTNLGNEVTRATTAEGTLTTNLAAEVTRATGAEEAIAATVTAETDRATGVEEALQDAIDAEATTRGAADTALDGRITTEVSDRTTAVNTVAGNLATEVSRAGAAEGVLQANIDAEVTRASAAESAIRSEISSALAGLTWEAPVNFMVTDHTTVTGQPVGTRVLDLTDNKIYTVTADGFNAGELLVDGAAFFFTVDDAGYVFNGTSVVQFNGAGAINAGNGLTKTGNTINVASTSGTITVTADSIDVAAAVLADIEANESAISAEVDRATTAEDGLSDRIDNEEQARIDAIATEVSDRNAAIAGEEGRATAAEEDLDARITAEVSRATAAEGVATTAIGAEVTRAQAAEVALGGRIDTEIADRNTAISGAIATEVAARDTAIGVETTRATAAETALTGRINSMYFLYTSTAAATSHTVTHNLGQRYCNVTVVDDSDNVVIPESIVFNSTTGLTVTFNSSIDCKVVVMGLAAVV